MSSRSTGTVDVFELQRQLVRAPGARFRLLLEVGLHQLDEALPDVQPRTVQPSVVGENVAVATCRAHLHDASTSRVSRVQTAVHFRQTANRLYIPGLYAEPHRKPIAVVPLLANG